MSCSETILVPDAFAYGGKAVASLPSGKRCFLRGGVPGDHLRIRMEKEKKSYAEASIEEIVKPSQSRIPPVCPYAGKCPGCSYLQISYSDELEWKQKQFAYFMRKTGVVPEERIRPPAVASARTGWRNKIRLTVEKNKTEVSVGYLGDDNTTVLDIRNCLLARPEISSRMTGLLADSAFRDSLPEGKSRLTFRFTPKDGVKLLERDSFDGLLTDSIPHYGEFQVSRDSFFQINTEMMSHLGEHFIRIAKSLKPELFVELYCGCGVFSALAAEAGIRKVYGVELDRGSIAAAELNLRARGLPHAKFLAGDAVKAVGQLPLAVNKASLLLVDPPRTGLDGALIGALGKSSVRNLIYVSCGPDTLARDLVLFGRQGWQVVETGLFDLFPSTFHFESLTLLSR